MIRNSLLLFFFVTNLLAIDSLERIPQAQLHEFTLDKSVYLRDPLDTYKYIYEEEFLKGPESISEKEQDSELNAIENRNWTKISSIATIIGAILTLATIVIMICSNKKQNKDTQKQINLLTQQSKQTEKQIINQERTLRVSSIESNKLIKTLNNNVEDIKEYTVRKDLSIKITELKEDIYSSYKFMYESIFCQEIAKIKDGTIIKDPTVYSNVVRIATNITTVISLIPNELYKCDASDLCLDDLKMLSKKRRKGDNKSEWLKNMNAHFEQLNNELKDILDEMKPN